MCLQEDDRPASRNFRGLQVIRSAQVAHEAKGKAKIAAMQEFYSTCFLRIMKPIQARSPATSGAARRQLLHSADMCSSGTSPMGFELGVLTRSPCLRAPLVQMSAKS